VKHAGWRVSPTRGEDEGLLAGLVGFANLAEDHCEQLLEGHAACGLMRSIRHMLNRIEDNPPSAGRRKTSP